MDDFARVSQAFDKDAAQLLSFRNFILISLGSKSKSNARCQWIDPLFVQSKLHGDESDLSEQSSTFQTEGSSCSNDLR